MKREIKKVAVIGAGTMGSGIAAQIANAGYEVVMFDLKKEDADKAVQRMLKAKPTDAFNAGFMHPKNAKLIETATSPDDFAKLADCDWIIMSILAPVAIRQKVFRQIMQHARKDAIISDNTSMDPTADIVNGMDDDFKKRFLNTHFFNPVRFMHLLEIIPGEDTDPEIIKTVSDFGDKALGKKIVLCKDDRGFIANRDGIYPIKRARTEAVAQGLTVIDVDAIMGTAFGFPKLGVFRLADEVGVDVVDHVSEDLFKHLPADDDFKKHYSGHDEVKDMLAAGYFGNRKAESKGGYYRKKPDINGKPVIGKNGKPVFQYRDLVTGEYQDSFESRFKNLGKTIQKMGGFQKFFDSDHDAAKFAWPVLRDTLVYAMNYAKGHAFDIQSVDDAMRAGYNWKWGPFELVDRFGVDWFTKNLKQDGIDIPPLLARANGQSFYQVRDGKLTVMDFDGNYAPVKREDGVINLDDIKRSSSPLVTHHSASLWNIGDGIVCLEFHSQQNSIDPSILHVINESIKLVSGSNGKYKGMVIYNDAPRFSVGANLKLAEVFMDAADNKWQGLLGKKQGRQMEKWAPRLGVPWLAYTGLKKILHEMIFQGQAVYTALNQAPFPVIGAPKGQPQNMAFGGGNEILMNCDAIQSGPEQVMGLPEIGVGILPAWTGTTRYLQRAFEAAKRGVKGPMVPVIRTAMALADPLNSTATSAQDAKRKLWLGPKDGITMNPDRVLADAKAKALAMAPDYKPKPLPVFALPGPSGRSAIRMDIDKMYIQGNPPALGVNHIDVQTADRLATVLTGGETLERKDVRRHAAAHHEHLEKLINEKPKGRLAVNTSLTLTYNRMMQLERDYILDAFRDRKNTWPRLRHTLATSAPLREQRPDPAPSPRELRESMKHEDLPRRDIDGQPLSGKNAERLAAMANMTKAFYRLAEARDPKEKSEQLKRTAKAIGCVFLKL